MLVSLKIGWTEALGRLQLNDSCVRFSSVCQVHPEMEADCGIFWIKSRSALQRIEGRIRFLEPLVCHTQGVEALSILWSAVVVLQENRNRIGILLYRYQHSAQCNSGDIHAGVKLQGSAEF